MATCGSLAAIVRVPECLARGRCQRMQDVDRIADVETLAEPAGHRRAGVDVKASCVVLPPEAERSIRLPLDLVAVLVDRAMVAATEQRQV